MSHLGARVTALMDGELSPDVAARAHAHAAACDECRLAVEAERSVRAKVQSAADPSVPDGLMAALLAMGGPEGPLPPRPGHLPGTPRPEALSLPRRPAGRSESSGPGRGTARRAAGTPSDRPDAVGQPRPMRRQRSVRDGRAVPGGPGRGVRRRLTVAVIGSVSLASAGVLSMVVLGGLLVDSGQRTGTPTSGSTATATSDVSVHTDVSALTVRHVAAVPPAAALSASPTP